MLSATKLPIYPLFVCFSSSDNDKHSPPFSPIISLLRTTSNGVVNSCATSVDYFSVRDILLGDSVYTPRKNMVLVYKKGYTETRLSVKKEEFNSIIAWPRVTSEHTIGILKSRLCSLREIYLKITEDLSLFKNEGAKLCKSLYHYSQPSYLFFLSQFWTRRHWLGHANITTERNRVNVDVNTDSYTSGKNRRQQVYDCLLYDGVYERVIADRLKALTQDCFDWEDKTEVQVYHILIK